MSSGRERVRVLGIGSPSGDDQAGWLTVDVLLARNLHLGREVIIEKLDRPGVNLIAMLEDTPWVILVDAMHSNGQVGQIQRFDQHDWPHYRQGLSSHGLGVLDALTLARELGCLPARLDVYGIEIEAVMPGGGVGKTTQAAARKLADIIANDLSETEGA